MATTASLLNNNSHTNKLWMREGSPSFEEEVRQLRVLLENERKSYATSQAIMYCENSPVDYGQSASDRDQFVSRYRTITQDFHFSVRVFFKSTLLLDTFLSIRKFKNCHLKAVAAACYSIATKFLENVDSILALSHSLVNKYYPECTRSDVELMETYLLQTPELGAIHSLCTVQDFIRKFHLLAIKRQMFTLPPHLTVSAHLCHLYNCAQLVVCNHHLMKYRPSMIALAILGCDLKQLHCEWLSTLLYLEELMQVKGGELSICYEAIAAYFPCIFTSCPPLPLASSPTTPPTKPPRQKSRELTAHGSHDDEDDEEDEGKEDVLKERKVGRRKVKRKYRPPLSRTINVAIV